MAPIRMIAHLYPVKGKRDEVISLLQSVADYVRQNEPGTTEYSITHNIKPDAEGNQDIVMIETYKDKAALKIHGESDAFKKFQKTLAEKKLIRKAPLLEPVSEAGGFISRL